MARGVNKVILIGNVGGDPETRYMPNGNAVTNITLATTDSWKDKQTGQLQERTEWHRVVLFGKVAEIAGEYLRKGSQCYIEGRLQTREDALVWVRQALHERFADKTSFDRMILRLAEQGRVQLQSHDLPSQLSPEEREAMIPNPWGGYYMAIGIRME